MQAIDTLGLAQSREIRLISPQNVFGAEDHDNLDYCGLLTTTEVIIGFLSDCSS
jgi:hypothetical protein